MSPRRREAGSLSVPRGRLQTRLRRLATATALSTFARSVGAEDSAAGVSGAATGSRSLAQPARTVTAASAAAILVIVAP